MLLIGGVVNPCIPFNRRPCPRPPGRVCTPRTHPAISLGKPQKCRCGCRERPPLPPARRSLFGRAGRGAGGRCGRGVSGVAGGSEVQRTDIHLCCNGGVVLRAATPRLPRAEARSSRGVADRWGTLWRFQPISTVSRRLPARIPAVAGAGGQGRQRPVRSGRRRTARGLDTPSDRRRRARTD